MDVSVRLFDVDILNYIILYDLISVNTHNTRLLYNHQWITHTLPPIGGGVEEVEVTPVV